MGILDEAIREHLDLKRRRGADPSEVERLEREALGPVRRAPQDASQSLLDEESAQVGSYPSEQEMPYSLDEDAPDWDESGEEPDPYDRISGPAGDSEDWSEPPTEIGRLPEDEDVEPAPERAYEAPRHHEIAEEWEAHERGMGVEPAGFEPDEPAPAPPAPAPAPDNPPPPAGPVFGAERQRPLPAERPELDQETAEYRVEDEVEAEEADPVEGEDVLEETPDFLQDTPDHDRLWFEQRPPRDFDFEE